MRYSNTKENQFERTKIKDIRKNTRAALDEVGLVHTIDYLRKDEYIEIPASVEIIPAEFSNARHYIKKGRHLNVPVPKARYGCIEERKGIMARIKQRMGKAKGKYRGYGWTGLNPRRHKLFSLVNNIEGLELFSAVNSDLHEGKFEVRDYNKRSVTYVPSRSEKGRRHKVDLLSLPIDDLENSKKHYADILNLEAFCDCEDASFHGRLNWKYEHGEDRFCAHAVAAYFAVAQEKANKSRRQRIRQSPFPIPTTGMMKFSDKLSNNVIRERKIDDRVRADLLSKTEKEILLWGFVEAHEFNDLFWFDDSARLARYAASCYAVDM